MNRLLEFSSKLLMNYRRVQIGGAKEQIKTTDMVFELLGKLVPIVEFNYTYHKDKNYADEQTNKFIERSKSLVEMMDVKYLNEALMYIIYFILSGELEFFYAILTCISEVELREYKSVGEFLDLMEATTKDLVNQKDKVLMNVSRYPLLFSDKGKPTDDLFATLKQLNMILESSVYRPLPNKNISKLKGMLQYDPSRKYLLRRSIRTYLMNVHAVTKQMLEDISKKISSKPQFEAIVSSITTASDRIENGLVPEEAFTNANFIFVISHYYKLKAIYDSLSRLKSPVDLNGPIQDVQYGGGFGQWFKNVLLGSLTIGQKTEVIDTSRSYFNSKSDIFNLLNEIDFNKDRFTTYLGESLRYVDSFRKVHVTYKNRADTIEFDHYYALPSLRALKAYMDSIDNVKNKRFSDLMKSLQSLFMEGVDMNVINSNNKLLQERENILKEPYVYNATNQYINELLNTKQSVEINAELFSNTIIKLYRFIASINDDIDEEYDDKLNIENRCIANYHLVYMYNRLVKLGIDNKLFDEKARSQIALNTIKLVCGDDAEKIYNPTMLKSKCTDDKIAAAFDKNAMSMITSMNCSQKLLKLRFYGLKTKLIPIEALAKYRIDNTVANVFAALEDVLRYYKDLYYHRIALGNLTPNETLLKGKDEGFLMVSSQPYDEKHYKLLSYIKYAENGSMDTIFVGISKIRNIDGPKPKFNAFMSYINEFVPQNPDNVTLEDIAVLELKEDIYNMFADKFKQEIVESVVYDPTIIINGFRDAVNVHKSALNLQSISFDEIIKILKITELQPQKEVMYETSKEIVDQDATNIVVDALKQIVVASDELKQFSHNDLLEIMADYTSVIGESSLFVKSNEIKECIDEYCKKYNIDVIRFMSHYARTYYDQYMSLPKQESKEASDLLVQMYCTTFTFMANAKYNHIESIMISTMDLLEIFTRDLELAEDEGLARYLPSQSTMIKILILSAVFGMGAKYTLDTLGKMERPGIVVNQDSTARIRAGTSSELATLDQPMSEPAVPTATTTTALINVSTMSSGLPDNRHIEDEIFSDAYEMEVAPAMIESDALGLVLTNAIASGSAIDISKIKPVELECIVGNNVAILRVGNQTVTMLSEKGDLTKLVLDRLGFMDKSQFSTSISQTPGTALSVFTDRVTPDSLSVDQLNSPLVLASNNSSVVISNVVSQINRLSMRPKDVPRQLPTTEFRGTAALFDLPRLHIRGTINNGIIQITNLQRYLPSARTGNAVTVYGQSYDVVMNSFGEFLQTPAGEFALPIAANGDHVDIYQGSPTNPSIIKDALMLIDDKPAVISSIGTSLVTDEVVPGMLSPIANRINTIDSRLILKIVRMDEKAMSTALMVRPEVLSIDAPKEMAIVPVTKTTPLTDIVLNPQSPIVLANRIASVNSTVGSLMTVVRPIIEVVPKPTPTVAELSLIPPVVSEKRPMVIPSLLPTKAEIVEVKPGAKPDVIPTLPSVIETEPALPSVEIKPALPPVEIKPAAPPVEIKPAAPPVEIKPAAPPVAKPLEVIPPLTPSEKPTPSPIIKKFQEKLAKGDICETDLKQLLNLAGFVPLFGMPNYGWWRVNPTVHFNDKQIFDCLTKFGFIRFIHYDNMWVRVDYNRDMSPFV